MFAELIGFVASALLLYSAITPNDHSLVKIQSLSNAFWFFHFIMMGSITGGIAAIFGIVRFLFVFKWKTPLAKLFYIIPFGIFSIAQFYFIDSLSQAIPIIAIFTISVGILYLSKHQLTATLFVGKFLLFLFGLSIGSVSASINYFLMMGLLIYRTYKISVVEQEKTA